MKVAKSLFISRPRRNLQTFLQFPLPNFHCQILWNGSNVIKVELRVVYSYWQLKAMSNLPKYLLNQHARGKRCVGLCRSWAFSGNLCRFRMGLVVRVFVQGSTNMCACKWHFESNSPLLVLHLSDSENGCCVTPSEDVPESCPSRLLGCSLPVTFHSRCAGERGKHSGVWQEQHAATANSCLDTSQVFLHFPPFHLSLCLQWCTCPFKRICAVRAVACECVYGTLQIYSDPHQFTFLKTAVLVIIAIQTPNSQ